MTPPNFLARADVREWQGAPALFINDQAVFPLLLMTPPHALRDLQNVAPSEIHLLTDVFPLGWLGKNGCDFTEFDTKMRAYLEVDENALLMPRVHLDAPLSWLDAHPDEQIDYADETVWETETCWGPVRAASLASRLYRDAAREALSLLVRYARQQDYAAHIFGWHIGAGVYGEWHTTNAPSYPDTSPAFVRAFEKWLAARYPDEKPAPRLPTIQERKQADFGVFRDPHSSRWFRDHAEFFHLQGAEMLSELAAAAKKESAGRSLVLAFNGYFPELDVCQEIDHRAFEHTVRDPDIDAFSSPHTYGRRKIGDDAALRGFVGSVRARGKLWVDEADERTHLAHPTQWKHVETAEQGIELLWRSFAHALAHSCGLWFMDQGGMWFMKEGGSWYRDARILAAFARMKRIGAASMQRSRARDAQIAVVANLKTAWHLAERAAGIDNISDVLMNDQMKELARCGAPFDVHLLADLFSPEVPDYSAYIFLDAFALTDDELTNIEALRDAGKTLVFLYAAGILSETEMSLDRMRDLLGIDVQMTDAIVLPNEKMQPPGFTVAGASSYVQAKNVFYCAAPPLSTNDLREILRAANVHIYSEGNDGLMVGGGYFSIHADGDGERTLRWPRAARWRNVRTDETVLESGDVLTTKLKHGETAIYAIDE